MDFLKRHQRVVGVCAIGLVTIALSTAFIGGGSVAPDFRQFEAGDERKSEFFAFMRPLIEAQNEALLEDRARLLDIADEESIGWFDRRWVTSLAERYGVATSDDDGERRPAEQLVDDLLLRVDAVPQSLALAQAAKESGWGTSRFAREGNNFYGEWCFQPGCGIVPGSRTEGRSHEVEAFESPAESVASYMRNINTHSGYKSFRKARKAQRQSRQSLSGVELASELTRYSERREAYVREIRNLIIYNDLENLTTAEAAQDGVGGS